MYGTERSFRQHIHATCMFDQCTSASVQCVPWMTTPLTVEYAEYQTDRPQRIQFIYGISIWACARVFALRWRSILILVWLCPNGEVWWTNSNSRRVYQWTDDRRQRCLSTSRQKYILKQLCARHSATNCSLENNGNGKNKNKKSYCSATINELALGRKVLRWWLL